MGVKATYLIRDKVAESIKHEYAKNLRGKVVTPAFVDKFVIFARDVICRPMSEIISRI
jgi:hypothetical protein